MHELLVLLLEVVHVRLRECESNAHAHSTRTFDASTTTPDCLVLNMYGTARLINDVEKRSAVSLHGSSDVHRCHGRLRRWRR